MTRPARARLNSFLRGLAMGTCDAHIVLSPAYCTFAIYGFVTTGAPFLLILAILLSPAIIARVLADTGPITLIPGLWAFTVTSKTEAVSG